MLSEILRSGWERYIHIYLTPHAASVLCQCLIIPATLSSPYSSFISLIRHPSSHLIAATKQLAVLIIYVHPFARYYSNCESTLLTALLSLRHEAVFISWNLAFAKGRPTCNFVHLFCFNLSVIIYLEFVLENQTPRYTYLAISSLVELGLMADNYVQPAKHNLSHSIYNIDQLL